MSRDQLFRSIDIGSGVGPGVPLIDVKRSPRRENFKSNIISALP